MRAFTVIAAILFPALAFGQTTIVSHHQLKGDSLREAGNLKMAIEAYQSDFRRNPNDIGNTYNLACALAVDGQKDSAFLYLFRYLKKDTVVKDLQMLTDVDWIKLHEDSLWTKVENDRMKRYQKFSRNAIKDVDYSLLLLRMYATDQSLRKELPKLQKKYGMNSTQVQQLWSDQSGIDNKNLQILLEQIDRKGWPKISVVGKEASNSAFLIVQHSDLETMEKFLPELKRLCEQSEAKCENYALMYDRVQVARTGTQLYGSQVYYDRKKKEWTLNPITDEPNLSKRRKEMGLQPIDEYLSHWGIKYGAQNQDPQKPLPASVSDYAVDSVFHRGQKIIRQETYFSNTRGGDFPLGWAISTRQQMNILFDATSTNKRVSYIGVLNGQAALIVQDSIGAKIWDKTAGLEFVDINANHVQLPNSFTLECSYFLDDSTGAKNGGSEFVIFFKEPKAKLKNELNIRITGSGAFEINCDANDPNMGLNTSKDDKTFRWSYAKATGTNTQFHQEVTGQMPGTFDRKSWHKISLSYSRWRLRCWLDGRYIGSIESRMAPAVFKIASVATFGINNVVLAKLNDDDDVTALSTTKKLVTHAIHFDVNKYEVKEESRSFLKQIADWMSNNKTARIEITGHTDTSGDAKANVELSQKRAEAIKTVLVSFGITEDRLIAKGFGASKPMYSNATEEGKAGNRRVEFLVL